MAFPEKYPAEIWRSSPCSSSSLMTVRKLSSPYRFFPYQSLWS